MSGYNRLQTTCKQAEIEAIRGVVSDGAMKTLLEKLVTFPEEVTSQVNLSNTVQHTNSEIFRLNKIEDLPRIEEFEAIARENR